MVIWAEPAVGDLKEIHNYISKDSIFYAEEVIDEILKETESLDLEPDKGPMVHELEEENLREIGIGIYRIIYEKDAREIRILTIIHDSRNRSSCSLMGSIEKEFFCSGKSVKKEKVKK